MACYENIRIGLAESKYPRDNGKPIIHSKLSFRRYCVGKLHFGIRKRCQHSAYLGINILYPQNTTNLQRRAVEQNEADIHLGGVLPLPCSGFQSGSGLGSLYSGL